MERSTYFNGFCSVCVVKRQFKNVGLVDLRVGCDGDMSTGDRWTFELLLGA